MEEGVLDDYEGGGGALSKVEVMPGISLPTLDPPEVGEEGSEAQGAGEESGQAQKSGLVDVGSAGPIVLSDVKSEYADDIDSASTTLLSDPQGVDTGGLVPSENYNVDFFDDLEGSSLTEAEEHQEMKRRVRQRQG